MNSEPDETPDEKDPDETEANLNIEDILTTGRGMMMSRMREIEEADSRGEPLDITPEERLEYEEGQAELAEVMQSFRRRMVEPFEAINKQLMGIAVGAIRLPKMNLPKIKTPGFLPPEVSAADSWDVFQKPRLPEVLSYTPPEPLIGQEELASIAEATRERDELQEQIQGNTFRTAVAMKKMLDEMENEADRVKKQSQEDAKRWWWVFVVASLTLIFAGIAAIPIMAPFFDQVWKAVTGG
jgi:hypothetical protein